MVLPEGAVTVSSGFKPPEAPRFKIEILIVIPPYAE
jgi:hypothetical protein